MNTTTPGAVSLALAKLAYGLGGLLHHLPAPHSMAHGALAVFIEPTYRVSAVVVGISYLAHCVPLLWLKGESTLARTLVTVTALAAVGCLTLAHALGACAPADSWLVIVWADSAYHKSQVTLASAYAAYGGFKLIRAVKGWAAARRSADR